MEFIAEDPVHVAVRSEVPALYDQRGHMLAQKERRVYAKFKRGFAPAYAIEIAKATYGFRKRPDEIPVELWVAYYDSVQDQQERNLTDDERRAIEEKLVAQGYVQVSKPRIEPPYGNYDKHRKTQGRRTIDVAIKDIVNAYETAGFNLDLAVAYEQENGNDPQVLAALEGLRDLEPEAVEETVIEA